ncbi:hypothetical protein [Streptomyces sp. NPDC127112]|uniref:hypothetical protein n=1 Tax=Streptomyces sp. NPDC127112 TaxID=3345364 RepID=UPI00362882A7
MDVKRGHEDPERGGVPVPDTGAMVDEHGRPPGVPSRTGTGAGAAADPARVDAARLPEGPMAEAESEAEVNVLVSHCDREGAEAVLGVLAEAFPDMTPPVTAKPPAGAATGTASVAPSIWAVTVDARRRAPGAVLRRARPASPVTAELDGAAEPVRRVRDVLEHAFAGEHLGTVSGEHELQVALRLTARDDA